MPADLTDVVLVSNRGPVAFRLEGDQVVPAPVGGGLAATLRPLMQGTGASWVACALGAADRRAVAEGKLASDGLHLDLIQPDEVTYDLAYNVIANATLWFCHHHLFDSTHDPVFDASWHDAWDAYRSLNVTIAQRVAEVAPDGGRVLVQDYHLALVADHLRALRPDLGVAHFSHTPFADPAVLASLPEAATSELLTGMRAAVRAGFHSSRWATSYRSSAGPEAPTFVSPLSVDADHLAAEASSPEVTAAGIRLEELLGAQDRQVIVRVDRMELSKNLLRGFLAFEELLVREPHRRGSVTFLALAYPTRLELPAYAAYRAEVETLVARINDRWATPSWTPIVLLVDDDYPRSLAALKRSDVLLVNPVRDGLNLVGKEGALINERQGRLVLSRQAGAYDELGHAAFGIHPFDCSATATALAEALDCTPEERQARADALRNAVLSRTPQDWLDDQLSATRRPTH